MSRLKVSELCGTLGQHVTETIEKARELQQMNDADLNRAPAPGKWSIAQVVEHLNSYNRYYMPEIEKAIQHGRALGIEAKPDYKPGWFGNYFTRMMEPTTEGRVTKKYKAPKDHIPVANLDSKKVLSEFIESQNRLIDFLQQAEHTDIGKLKVPISISKYIKLKLGDTFRFLIAHQQRHFIQVANTVRVIIPKPGRYSATLAGKEI